MSKHSGAANVSDVFPAPAWTGPTTNPHAYWAYDSAAHLAWLRPRGLIPRIARPGIESGERLGRHRWKIERSIAWLFGYRRLTVRYERKGSNFLAFLGLAAALICYKKLAKLTT
ncbi:transposase [Streptomyces sp. NPDC005827]|uniref:transposase n=1 Tax=Streptomyces sp. NPDC005827 TaxID=3157070 RepID=UPI0033F684D8